jgi:putative transposase
VVLCVRARIYSCRRKQNRRWALAPAMAKPDRNANSQEVLSTSRTFFVTSKTSMGRRLLQSERNANLLIDLLRTNMAAHKFKVHDFVIMPDHFHLLVTVEGDTSIEKVMQLIKGGFSFRLKKEFGFSGEVWQRGFSDAHIPDKARFLKHREYIAMNPVKAGLVDSPEKFLYCFEFLAAQKSEMKLGEVWTGAKAQ